MLVKRTLRVVLVSPSDVQPERDAVQSIIDDVNHICRLLELPTFLELWRWETDAYPGLHLEGPQGIIDEQLRIEQSDVLIGIFRQRFGTPVADADSGTAHRRRVKFPPQIEGVENA